MTISMRELVSLMVGDNELRDSSLEYLTGAAKSVVIK
jgi:hypothetical protein